MHPTSIVCDNGGGAVEHESDSACVEVLCEGGRGDGFEDGDEFAEVHECFVGQRVI